MALCETFLRGSDILSVPGYKFIGNNRLVLHQNARRGSGGVCFLIKDKIFDLFNVSVLDSSKQDILWIKLKSKESDLCYCLCVCYLPPEGSSRHSDPNSFFNDLLCQTYEYQNEGIICISGDFNARIGHNTDFIEGVDNIPLRAVKDTTVNHYGDIFVDFLVDSNFCILNGRIGHQDNFTCVSKKGRSVVDYVVVPHENLPLISDFKVNLVSDLIESLNISVPERRPDHSLLEWKFAIPHTNLSDKNDNGIRSKRYNVAKLTTDFLLSDSCAARIEETIRTIETELNDNRHINGAYDTFVSFLTNEMDLAGLTEERSTQQKHNRVNSRYKPYWDDALQAKWDLSREKERMWLNCVIHTNIKSKLKQEYCRARADFDTLLRKTKRQYQMKLQNDLLKDLEKPNSRDFWKQIGKIGISNERDNKIPMEIIDDEGNLITGEQVVLNKWESDYRSLFSEESNNGQYDDCHLEYIKRLDCNSADTNSSQTSDISCLNDPVNRQEVEDAINRLKLKKASGIDNIPAEILKNSKCIHMLHDIISFCFDNGVSPDKWKQGIINPIVKPNSTDHRLPLSFRGITLLSVPCKVYCDILNHRFSEWLEDSNTLVDEQCGFRKKRSCLDNIYSLYSIVNDRKLSRLNTFTCFIDLKKAFDNVNRDCLWYKLMKYGINGKILNAVKSLYNNTACCVRLNNKLTSMIPVYSGVKQGCLISPTLFAIYINDLATDIKALNKGINIDGTNISILLYADDIVLLATSEIDLQSMLNCVNNWCFKWRLSINCDKSNIVHFRSNSIERSSFQFNCGDYVITYTDSYKYLGLWFDEHLSWDKAIRELSKSASRALGCLTTKFYVCGGMNYHVFTKLYESLVQPILLYGASIWGTTEHRLINNVQNRAAKIFLGVSKNTSNIAVHGELGWLSCAAKQKLEVFRYFYKLNHIDEDRIIHKINLWSKRKRRSWDYKVSRMMSDFSLDHLLSSGLCKQDFMNCVKLKIRIHDEQLWFFKLWDDHMNINGNKLRLYRRVKKDLIPEHYVKNSLPRHLRSCIAKLRCGTLPLTVETGRYNKPPIPLSQRLCPFCHHDIEDEVHFLVNCELYSDLRSILFDKALLINPAFYAMSSFEQFIFLLQTGDIQYDLGTLLYNMLRRRRAFLVKL